MEPITELISAKYWQKAAFRTDSWSKSRLPELDFDRISRTENVPKFSNSKKNCKCVMLGSNRIMWKWKKLTRESCGGTEAWVWKGDLYRCTTPYPFSREVPAPITLFKGSPSPPSLSFMLSNSSGTDVTIHLRTISVPTVTSSFHGC